MIEWLFFLINLPFKFLKWREKNRETEKQGVRDVLALDKYKMNCGCLGFSGRVEAGRRQRVCGDWHGPGSLGEIKGVRKSKSWIKASGIRFRAIHKSSSLEFLVSSLCLWYHFLRPSIITTNHLALKSQKFKKFWRIEFQYQDINRALLCPKAVGKKLLASSSFQWLPTIREIPCLSCRVSPVFAPVFTWFPPFCVSASKSPSSSIINTVAIKLKVKYYFTLTWLHLQILYFQMRSHSQVSGLRLERTFLEKTIQPTTSLLESFYGRRFGVLVAFRSFIILIMNSTQFSNVLFFLFPLHKTCYKWTILC